MKGHWRLSLIAAFFVLACACISCESNSNHGDPGDILPPTEDMELVGTWAGYFVSGADDKLDDADSSGDDDLEFDDDDIFAIGIITREKEARFIGDTSQFVCPEGSLSVDNTLSVRTIFGGHLDYYVWNTTGGNAPYTADVEHISIYGDAFLSIYFLNGLYWYTDVPEAERDYWQFQFFNYTTTGIAADIEKLAGEWTISHAFKRDNTLRFTITPTGDAGGSISGTDTDGNTIDGNIVEIHYDDLHGTEIYDVALTLTTPADGAFDLEGLATYVSSYDTEGIEVTPSIAIGVSDGSRMVTGLAAPVPDE
jgi:hypothetical protein